MTSKVYVLTDEQNRILRIEGQYTLPSDLTGWVLIEEGNPCDRLNLAQTHYFPEAVCTLDGIPKYKLADGIPVLRSEEEMEADRQPDDPAPTIEERVTELEETAVTWEDMAAAIQEGVDSV